MIHGQNPLEAGYIAIIYNPYQKATMLYISSDDYGSRGVEAIDSFMKRQPAVARPGFELQFATNNLSHFLLTELLMPKLSLGR